MRRRVCYAIALIGLTRLAFAAAETAPDKSGFTLFRPTPDALLRELATDRPDKTENPYTVVPPDIQFPPFAHVAET